MEQILGQISAFTSVNTMGDLHSATMFLTAFFHSLKLSGLHDHPFKLKNKVNTVSIFLR